MTRQELIELMFAAYDKHQSGTDRMNAALEAARPYIVEECAVAAEGAVDPKHCKFEWTGAQKAAEAVRKLK